MDEKTILVDDLIDRLKEKRNEIKEIKVTETVIIHKAKITNKDGSEYKVTFTPNETPDAKLHSEIESEEIEDYIKMGIEGQMEEKTILVERSMMLIPEKCHKCNLNSNERLKKCEDCPYINHCEICGNSYETYAIILDCNPLSIASFLEEETKEDGTIRKICKSCRDKLREDKL